MKPKGLFFILLLLLSVGGCKKDNNGKAILDGNYAGKFLVSSQSGAILRDSVVVSLRQGQFNSLTSPSTLTTGKGSYLIQGGTTTFTNMEAFPDNTSVVTTAVLNGSYTYVIKGDSIFLAKTDASQNVYTYKLKKQ
ncbi:hypothetical protein SAMN05216490_3399 [Mucilaginibacter mallensis]|uniref:Lipocalin-like domain-containing protein n=1 Tax=Mucilaginibacter mallensis TaxID=652787 RepID=A0A1H2A6Q2_MUCMA|nr:hypothetical protein [Mucilaginibacter mallensis]SDT41557.1 hypothetical protein SAMN05216490_3399 [Mucilaginibacter mallensis]